MNAKFKQLFDSLEPLLSIQLQYADRLDLDTIQITTARAREILKQLRELKNTFPVSEQKTLSKYLDKKFAHTI